MKLDKAIEVYEFWADVHERDAEYHRPLGYSHESTANVAEMQAREERQFAEWLKELKAYRETYPYGVEGYPPRDELNSSEKPNNSTISKMEQVGKDINVRSKDEPQTDCETCKHYNPNHEAIACERCLDGKYSRYEPKDEPQTERKDK